MIEPLTADLRYGVRQFSRNPGLTSLIVITLAIGIGATTAIFSQFRAVYLQTLPVRDPDQLRLLSWSPTKPSAVYNSGRISYPAYVALRDGSTSFADVACWSGAFTNLGNRTRIETHIVSGNYFRTLGADARLGRVITPADEAAAAPVAVLSHAAWLRELGGDPTAVGREIRVNGVALTLIGVMPPAFLGMNPAQVADLYVPLMMYSSVRFRGGTATPRTLDDTRDWGGAGACELVARLAPNVSDQRAEAEANALVRNRYEAGLAFDPDSDARIWLIDASRGLANLRRDAAEPLRLLGIATTLLLLAACANVAGLLTARVRARSREIGNRVVVGASRGRLVRQHMTESFMLALGGGALGVPLAYVLNDVFPGPLAGRMSSGVYLGKVAADIDLPVLAFSVVVCTLASLVFGLVPALRATSVDPVVTLQSGSRTTASAGEIKRGRLLVAAQVAIAVVVMVGAGLLVRTLVNISQAPMGLDDSESVTFFSVRLAPDGYGGPQGIEFFERTVDSLETVPAVAVASGASSLFGWSAICPDGVAVAASGRTDGVRIDTWAVAPRYFEAIGTPLLSGREVGSNDGATARVAVVNAAFARRFPDLAVPGTVLAGCQPEAPPWEIVGVVADHRTFDLRDEIPPTVYIPFTQSDAERSFSEIRFALRALGGPTQVMPDVRRVIARIDPDMPLYNVETGAGLRDRLLGRERQTANVLIFFGVVALFLSCLGIYGVLSYSVTRRSAEIGVRMTVGASRGRVQRMIVRESVHPVVLGIVAGLVASPLLTGWIETMLFGVSRVDPFTISGVALAFLLTGGLAAYVPARKASLIQPMSALRSD